jgi:LuxR family maltose regulon positive regulatory protein
LGHLEIARNLGEAASLPENRHRWFVAMSRIKEASGDLETALDSLDEAEHQYVDGCFPNPVRSPQ